MMDIWRLRRLIQLPLCCHVHRNCQSGRKNEKIKACDGQPLLRDPCHENRRPKCFKSLRESMKLGCPSTSRAICLPTEAIRKKLKFWRMVSLGSLPLVGIMTIVTLIRVEEENRKPRPEFLPVPYMYRRTKRFPWGDGNHSFFHNPVKNPVPPHGYEVPDPNAITKTLPEAPE